MMHKAARRPRRPGVQAWLPRSLRSRTQVGRPEPAPHRHSGKRPAAGTPRRRRHARGDAAPRHYLRSSRWARRARCLHAGPEGPSWPGAPRKTVSKTHALPAQPRTALRFPPFVTVPRRGTPASQAALRQAPRTNIISPPLALRLPLLSSPSRQLRRLQLRLGPTGEWELGTHVASHLSLRGAATPDTSPTPVPLQTGRSRRTRFPEPFRSSSTFTRTPVPGLLQLRPATTNDAQTATEPQSHPRLKWQRLLGVEIGPAHGPQVGGAWMSRGSGRGCAARAEPSGPLILASVGGAAGGDRGANPPRSCPLR
ncbi:uncharacterized protein [Saccopteryx leptura]|uniref:uncharacterized protein n=1 Tax=Saccopteryx leptura TaxID=249018 RepID=UPI00339BC92A